MVHKISFYMIYFSRKKVYEDSIYDRVITADNLISRS